MKELPRDGAVSQDAHPTYQHSKIVPASVIDACLYTLGYQQWLSPNADIEYVQESRKISQGIYAAILISHSQCYQSDKYSSGPNWESLREFRDSIYDRHFYVPELFHMTDYDTPDSMFDAVEAELVAHELLQDTPPERETDYVDA